MTKIPMRLQIAVDDTLYAECIVSDFDEATRIRDAWVNRRHDRKENTGTSVINRADITRLWNTSIGSMIPYDV